MQLSTLFATIFLDKEVLKMLGLQNLGSLVEMLWVNCTSKPFLLVFKTMLVGLLDNRIRLDTSLFGGIIFQTGLRRGAFGKT
jgi:hypothetical protein